MSPELATLSLISTMSKALDRLSDGELLGVRFRNCAYVTSDAWGFLNLIPEYEFRWLDEAALTAQRARRSVMAEALKCAA